MNIRIDNKDSNLTARLKLVYLVPVVLLIWVPYAVWIGFRELGLPWDECRIAWNHNRRPK